MRVHAIEPNAEMRALAERRFRDEPRFRSIAGTAEATTLETGSIDLVVAAQAFHWFRPRETRAEFLRVLRSPARVALLWNTRRRDTPLERAYEKLLERHGTDYERIAHDRPGRRPLMEFFGEPPEERRFENEQLLDRDALRGRLLSVSYLPGPGEPGYDEMMAELNGLFDEHAIDRRVRLGYETELFLGRLSPDAGTRAE